MTVVVAETPVGFGMSDEFETHTVGIEYVDTVLERRVERSVGSERDPADKARHREGAAGVIVRGDREDAVLSDLDHPDKTPLLVPERALEKLGAVVIVEFCLFHGYYSFLAFAVRVTIRAALIF